MDRVQRGQLSLTGSQPDGNTHDRQSFRFATSKSRRGPITRVLKAT